MDLPSRKPSKKSPKPNPSPAEHSDDHHKKPLFLLTLAALGVVFGDIGTSPLYALRECFGGVNGIPNDTAVMGALSLLFWTLVMVVSIKYTLIVMRADNRGEGGILALTALALKSDHGKSKRRVAVISTLGILGAALLYSDGIITPAISVLSAVEGLSEITPNFEPYIVPIALVILVGLFLVQSKGTGKVGTFFGPMLVIWFSTLGILGISSIVHNPAILGAINPYWAFNYLIENSFHSVVILGAVFLSITGVEVLYADMGHFGRKPIMVAWYFLVFPCLLLNYFGQGAILLGSTEPVGNLFFRLVPEWFMLPLVIIATAATVIASQAVISGAFSMIRQSVQLGFWPRLQIKHTSNHTVGQVYVPLMNWILLFGTVSLILIFRESGKLAAAYGLAVSFDMLITTVLTVLIALGIWKKKARIVIPVALLFLMIDLAFFTANAVKIVHGGWIVICITTVIFLFMVTWIRGGKAMWSIISDGALDLKMFVADPGIARLHRAEDIAIYLAANSTTVPRAMLHNIKHNKVLHEKTIILSIQTEEIPFVKDADRISWEELGQGIYRMSITFGFSEIPDVPLALMNAVIPGVEFHPMKTSYFMGRDSVVVGKKSQFMPFWMKHIYVFMAHNALDATSFFRLPPNRVVQLGGRNEL